MIEFLPPKHPESLAGILTGATTMHAPSEEELQAAIEQAWEEAAQKAVARSAVPARVWTFDEKFPAGGIRVQRP